MLSLLLAALCIYILRHFIKTKQKKAAIIYAGVQIFIVACLHSALTIEGVSTFFLMCGLFSNALFLAVYLWAEKKMAARAEEKRKDAEWEYKMYLVNRPEARANLLNNSTGIPIGFTFEPEKDQSLRYTGDRHLITFGPIGSGKNTTAQTPALIEYAGSALVIDPKGQLAAITAKHRQTAFGHDILILNPFGVLSLPTATYNPLRYLDPAAATFFSDCKRIAEGLVDIQKADHWETSALDVVTLLIMWTVLYEEEKDLVTVRRLLNQADQERILFFEKMMGCPVPALAEGAARFTLKDTEVRNCIQNAVNKLSFLRDPGIERVIRGGGSHEISFADLKRKAMTAYLIIPPELLHTHGRFLRLIVMSALGELMKETTRPTNAVLFMLDEFAQLGPMPLVENAASIVRDYAIKLWLILQNLPQLKTLYGDKWESFLSSAGVVQFFTPNDLETAKYVSERSGIKIEERKSTSKNSSRNYSTGYSSGESETKTEQQVPRFTVQDVLGLSSTFELLICPGVNDAIQGYRRNYWELPNWATCVEPDPYHMTTEQRAEWENQMKSGDTYFHRVSAPPALEMTAPQVASI